MQAATKLEWVRWIRLLVAGLALAAVAAPIINGSASPLGNYFGYFTIWSNIAAAAVLLIGALRNPRGHEWQWIRGAVTTAMVITGLGYALLLDGAADDWVNTVVHRIMPVVVLIDWCLVAPGRLSRLAWLDWMVFPTIFVGYTTIRGAFTDWYPYPFLDPRADGYEAMFTEVVILFVVMTLLSLAVWLAGTASARLLRRDKRPLESTR